MKRYTLLSLLILLPSLYAQEDVTSKASLFERQWGLKNTGQTMVRPTGDLTRSNMTGVAGVDINWLTHEEIREKLQRRGEQSLKNEVVVAVVDSGLDLNNPGFENRVWENPDCQGLDDEMRLKRPCQGWNFLDNNSDLKDENGHGTHVAGIIAANPETSKVFGVAPENIKIMPLKVLNDEMNGLSYNNKVITDIIADSIIFAINAGADIINMSFGWPELIHTPRMQGALEAAEKEDVLIIAASGNNNKDVPIYPCTTRGVICVGSIDHTGEISEFSNFSGKVDLLAPGESIISLFPTQLESRSLRIQGHEIKRGSSQAAPFVSGVAAVVKLLRPELNVEQIKAILLHSSTPIQEKASNKTSKYGLVNMKKAVSTSLEELAFVTPEFKDLLEIQLDQNFNFSFDLPLSNHLQEVENIVVHLEMSDTQVKLEQDQFFFEKIDGASTQNIQIKGSLNDLSIDSHIDLKVRVTDQEQMLTYFQGQTNLAFSRKVLDVDQLKSFSLNVHPEIVSFFGRQQKGSRMRRVSDASHNPSGPEWFFQDPRLRSQMSSAVDVLALEEGRSVIKRFITPRFNQLLSVFKVDLNFDGEQDYLIYALGQERRSLLLMVFNDQGEKLFGDKSEWSLPLSGFEGLPLQNGVESFGWIRIDHPELGPINMPSFHKNWILPEEDNTNDLLDRLNPGRERRPYYLYPEIQENGEVIIKERTLQSYDFISQLREKGLFKDFDEIVSSNALPQSSEQRDAGLLKIVYLIGKEAMKRPYLLEFSSANEWAITPMILGVTQLEGNNHLAFRGLEGLQVSEVFGFMALINRSRARLSLIDEREQRPEEIDQVQLPTQSWNDPIFNTLGAFESTEKKSKTILLETRYHVYSIVLNDNQAPQKQKLPINRESSFPGISFSETLRPIVISKGQQNLPGLMVNSSLIYGDRIYAMVQSGDEFKRPVSLSFSFPENCLYLDSAQRGERDYSFVLCRDHSRPLLEQMKLIQVPLAQP